MNAARSDLPVYIPVRRLYFGGVRRQSGRGFLSFLGNLATKLLPFAQKYIFPSAIRGAQGLAADVLSGEKSFKKSLKSRGIGALKGMARSYLDEEQEGTGFRQKQKRRRVRSTTVSARPTKRRRRSQRKPAIKKRKTTTTTTTTRKQKQRRSKRKTKTPRLPVWQPNIISSSTKKPKRILFAPKHGR